MQVCNFTMLQKKVTYETIYPNCNSFKVTTDLLNKENLKVAIAQLCHEWQVCNFAVIADPKVAEY